MNIRPINFGSSKLSKTVTITLLVLTFVVAGVAVIFAYLLQKNDSVTPTPSDAAKSCKDVGQEAYDNCCRVINNDPTNSFGGVPSMGTVCAASAVNYCESQRNKDQKKCELLAGQDNPTSPTQDPNPTVVIDDPTPTGTNPTSTVVPNCDGNTTPYAYGNGLKGQVTIVNCSNQPLVVSCKTYQFKCDSIGGTNCSENGTTSTYSVTLAAGQTKVESVSCNPNACGSCQADIECYGAQDGIYNQAAVACATATQNPTRRPSTATSTSTTTTATSQPGIGSGSSVTATTNPTNSTVPSTTATNGTLTITKSANPSAVSPNGTIAYEAVIKNTSTSAATVNQIVDDYADSFTYVAGTAFVVMPGATSQTAKEPSVANGKLTWDFSSVSIAPSAQMVIRYSLKASATTGTFPNSICITSPTSLCANASVVVSSQPNTAASPITIFIISGLMIAVGVFPFVFFSKRRYLDN